MELKGIKRGVLIGNIRIYRFKNSGGRHRYLPIAITVHFPVTSWLLMGYEIVFLGFGLGLLHAIS
jgi:hypothetical protein